MPRSWLVGCVYSTSMLAARFVRAHTQCYCYWIFFSEMLCYFKDNWHFFDFETFCRTKKKAVLDVCLNEYEAVNCQPNLILLFPTGGLRGPILLLTASLGEWVGGQSDRIHFSALLLLHRRTAIIRFDTMKQIESFNHCDFTGGSVHCSLSSKILLLTVALPVELPLFPPCICSL